MQIIAEVGLNHLGCVKRAQRLLNSVLESEVNAVTFQIRESSFYDGTSYKTLLPDQFYIDAFNQTKSANKQFGLAIRANNSIHLPADFWKMLSFGDHELLHKLHKPVFVSTGSMTIDETAELSRAFPKVNFIYTQLDPSPSRANLLNITKIKQMVGKNIAYGLHSDVHTLYAAIAFEPIAVFFYVRDQEKVPDSSGVHISELASLVKNIKCVETSIGK